MITPIGCEQKFQNVRLTLTVNYLPLRGLDLKGDTIWCKGTSAI